MIPYLSHLVSGLASFSRSLNKKALFNDKPWVLVNHDGPSQKLIFKKNGELLMAIEGEVTSGKWEYLEEAKCILIDRVHDKILCNEAYVDENVLILKKDGSSDKHLILVNQITIPDLNYLAYLETIWISNNLIKTWVLKNGEILQIKMIAPGQPFPANGQDVFIGMQTIPDGTYVTDNDVVFTITNSSIENIHFIRYVESKSGESISILQKELDFYKKGDKVMIDGLPAPNGKYKIRKQSNFTVVNGIITYVSFF